MADNRMNGFDEKLGGWPMPWPVDLHHHCRTGEMAQIVTPVAAQYYRLITAMPNLGPDRIRTPQQAIEYREMLESIGRKTNKEFEVNVPLYLEPDTDPIVVEKGFRQRAWISAKLYPRGGTTHSAEGVDFLKLNELDSVFAVMAELGMLLLVHAEPTHDHNGAEIDVFEREDASLSILDEMLTRHPKLKVVFEHISSKAAVTQVEDWICRGFHISATVAPQYLTWNRNELFRGGMNPSKYSIPVLKTERDRLALRSFITGDETAWGLGFLGTDSAPHPLSAKSKPEGCSGGVFNSPTALFVYFDVFRETGYEDWFERFTQFACFNGPEFYGLPFTSTKHVLIAEEPWKVPPTYGYGKLAIQPMGANQECPYVLKELKYER